MNNEKELDKNDLAWELKGDNYLYEAYNLPTGQVLLIVNVVGVDKKHIFKDLKEARKMAILLEEAGGRKPGIETY